ncbi:MAG: hypothetical protein ACP5MT_02840 [Candidatus Acidifodinimicrobium sp.]
MALDYTVKLNGVKIRSSGAALSSLGIPRGINKLQSTQLCRHKEN